MLYYFDYDGTLDNPMIQRIANDLKKVGTVICLTTRNANDIDPDIYELCNNMGINYKALGEAIGDGLYSCKADYLRHAALFGPRDIMLFDNDPNEIAEAMKAGIAAVLVPSWMTEDFFEGN